MGKEKNKKWDKLGALDEHEASHLWEKTGAYKSAYEPDVEGAFSKFQQSIGSNQNSDSTKIKSIRRYTFLRVAATLLLLVGLVGVWQYFLKDTPMEELVTTDQTQEVLLADGTLVTLNKNSTLIYPNAFDGGKRVVQLKGEAFFTVAKNAKKPFIVKTDQAQIRVLGTVFNVRAYYTESFAEVAVREGKVEFGPIGSATKLTLTANERGTFDYSKNKLSEENSGVNEWGWKDARLSFKDAKMTEIKMILERFFNVRIDLKGDFDTCRLTANFGQENSLNTILDAIAVNVNISFSNDEAGDYTIIGHCQ